MKEHLLKYLKQAISFILVVAMLVSIIPNFVKQVHAATDVTAEVNLFENSGNGTDGFYIVISPGDGLETGGWTPYKGSCVYIDGTLQTGVPLYKVDSRVYYVGLVNAGFTASTNTTVKIEGTLTDGTNSVTFSSASFQYQSDGKWHEVLNETEVTLSIDSRSDTSGKDGFWFKVSPSDPLTFDVWTKYTGSCVYVDGDLQTSVPLFKADKNLYYVGLADAKLSASEGTIVTIDGRIESGNEAVVFERTYFQYQSDGKWHEILNETEVTLSIDSRSDESEADGFWFTVSPADPLTTSGWTKYKGSCVYVDGELQTSVPLFKATENLYYVGLKDATLSASVGTIVTIDGRIESGNEAVVFAKTSFQYQSDGKWYVLHETTKIDTSVDTERESTVDGIYLVTTPTDPLPAALDWKTKYSGECVYVDGVLDSNIKLIKILSNLYYVDLAAASVSVSEGTKIKLSGTITDGTSVVEFLAKTFVYTLDNSWEVYGSIPTATISNHSLNTTNNPEDTVQGLYFNVATTDNLSYENNWKAYYGDCVYVDGELVEDAKVIKAGEQIYYVALVDKEVVPVAGTVVEVAGVLGDGTNNVRFASHKFTYTGSGDWVDQDTQYLVMSVDNSRTKKDQIWIQGSVADKLDFNDTDNNGEGWKGYTGIVYVNGNLTSVKIYKNLSDLYVIYASELRTTVVDGLQVKIFGALTDEVNQIYYMPITLAYSEAEETWELVRNASTGVPGDANADGKFDVADIIRAKYEEQMGNATTRLVSEAALYEDAFGKAKVNVKKLHEIALSSEDGTPVYFDDETIMIAAYEGPKAAGATLYDKGTASGTLKSGQTPEEFQQFANAGLNTLIVETPTFVSVGNKNNADYALMGSGGGHWETLTKYIQKSMDANLDVIVSSEALNSYLEEKQATKADGVTKVDVNDTFLQRDLRQLLTGMVEESSTGSYPISVLVPGAKGMLAYSNFKGILMGDELPYEHFDAYTKAHNILKELDASVPTFNSQFAGMNEETGKSWAEEYGPISGTFCYDMYPYVKDGSMKNDWLYNLQLSAKAGLQHDFTTGITLQAHGQTVFNDVGGQLVEDESLGLRNPEEKDDIGFQVYTSLAYGMKYLSYYTYAPHRLQFNTHYYTGTMIEYDENQNIIETDTYRAVQAVNNEILKFDHVFLDYDWQGTIGISKNNKDELFGKLDNFSTEAISSYGATYDALIGCMFDPDKNMHGYWLVNAVNPKENQSNQVTVTFAGKTRAIVFNPSKGVYGEIQNLNNHTYTAELGSGEGQFVIPLP